jgi:DNA-directed RNA polymerase specialized sigma24 family protein
MAERDTTGNVFEEQRRYLFSIAYRLLGSVSDAEDVVQDAFLRWKQDEQPEVRSPRAYLATIVVRLCLDQLRSPRAKREVYVGPWLPEPLVTTGQSDLTDTGALPRISGASAFGSPIAIELLLVPLALGIAWLEIGRFAALRGS